jgi:hypothetical protein
MSKLKSTKYRSSWRDVGQALIMLVIGNTLVFISGLPNGQLPTLEDLKLTFITSIKFAVIPYLLKNFFKDDVKVAQITIEKAKEQAINEKLEK